MIHQIFSPNPSVLMDVSALAAAGDCVLLLGDGVYLQEQAAAHFTVYVRAQDAATRGLAVTASATSISDQEWLALTMSHTKPISWF
ncbi:DsrH/TusB family sulfur metabolism protein [Thalassolituus sp. LLYu03]|uniref:DsrH/TusB family sulfur metabolism protein n=1 Tax=Thalassolituus sp. LLYu03 TaxID=3421656 RepID=UPI003D27F2A6